MHRAALPLAGLGLLAAWAPASAQDMPKRAPIYAEYASELGASDIREVRLIVDGRDVTTDAAITPLRVTYAPTEAMKEGAHAAQVVVTDGMGRSWTKEWAFMVEPSRPAFEQVWSDALLIDLERPDRQVRERSLALQGWTQPGAEVVILLDGSEAERVLASATGRFRASLELRDGDNALELTARRVETGEEGPQVDVRVERLVPKPLPSDDDDGLVTRPPHRRLPVPRVGPPRVVLASAREFRLPEMGLPEMPSQEPPSKLPRERVERAPSDVAGVSPTAPDREMPSHEPPSKLPRERVARAPVDVAGVSPTAPDMEIPSEEPQPEGEVIITKPDDGDDLQPGHATVLGRAPAGWRVTVLVDGMPSGVDIANPAGHFTVPRVELAAGPHQLVAEAESGGHVLTSRPVNIEVSSPRFQLAPDLLALTSPQRGSSIARSSVQRVSGTAWDGAEVEVEVNGRIVAREMTGIGGRFDVDVPLESGLNVLRVEASALDGSRLTRSREYVVTAGSRTPAGIGTAVRLERPSRAPIAGTRGRAGLPGAAAPVPAGHP